MSNNSSESRLGWTESVLTFALGNITLVFYAWILATVVSEFHDFRNSFYKCLIGLGWVELAWLAYQANYVPICFWIGGWHPGFDHFLALLSLALGYTSALFQVLIGINRFCAVVLFAKYGRIFRNRNLYPMIIACYVGGALFALFVGLKADAVHLDLVFGVVDVWGAYRAIHYALVESGFAVLIALILLIVYSICFGFLRKRKAALSGSDQQERFGQETKLLVVGVLQSGFFILGVVSFAIKIPLPVSSRFHFYQGHIWASPFLYFAFDRKLRDYCLRRASVVPTA